MLGEPDSDLHARGSIYSNRCCIHLVLTYKEQKQQQVGQLACEEEGARQYGAWQRRAGCQGKVGQGGAGCQGKAGQSSSATCKLHGSSALENRCAGRGKPGRAERAARQLDRPAQHHGKKLAVLVELGM